MARENPPDDPHATPALRCETISHEYDHRDETGLLHAVMQRSPIATQPVQALQDVSLEINQGEIVGLAGPSGSGKSTLLHVIAGLLVPTTGTVELRGTDLTTCSARQRAQCRREAIGLIFQRFHLLPSLSAQSNVAVPLVQAGTAKHERRCHASTLLEQVGLATREGHRPGALSGGEQQRVAIARALVTNPTVVLADEPTGELDTETGRRVLEILTETAGDSTVVVASHDETALAATVRIIELHDGQVVDNGR